MVCLFNLSKLKSVSFSFDLLLSVTLLILELVLFSLFEVKERFKLTELLSL